MKNALLIIGFCLSLMTASPAFSQLPTGDIFPHLAFDSQGNMYLGTYTDAVSFGDTFARGQLLNPDATLQGGEIAVATSNTSLSPASAYDTAYHDYLTVWYQFNGSDNDVYGQFINNDGALMGENFKISDATTGDQWRPVIAFDASNGTFLVIWIDDRTGANHIYGQLMNGDGTPRGSNVVIFNGAAVNNNAPALAYDDANRRYLVAWADQSGGASSDIFGQLVNADGSLSGTSFAISAPATPDFQGDPSVAYNSMTDQYLVVWHDRRNTVNYNIYGQLVNADGSLSGGNIPITAEANDQINPAAVYEPTQNRFFVIWNFSDGGGDVYVYGQYMDPDGTLPGTASNVSTEIASGSPPSLAYNTLCSNSLVSYGATPNPGDPEVLRYKVVGDPCETTPPTVTAQSPADAAVDVAIDSTVTATFSEGMRASTITGDSFFLDKDTAGTVTYDEATNTATFTPSENLKPETTYNAVITTAVKDLVGNALAADVMWTFTTAAQAVASSGGCSLMPRRH